MATSHEFIQELSLFGFKVDPLKAYNFHSAEGKSELTLDAGMGGDNDGSLVRIIGDEKRNKIRVLRIVAGTQAELTIDTASGIRRLTLSGSGEVVFDTNGKPLKSEGELARFIPDTINVAALHAWLLTDQSFTSHRLTQSLYNALPLV